MSLSSWCFVIKCCYKFWFGRYFNSVVKENCKNKFKLFYIITITYAFLVDILWWSIVINYDWFDPYYQSVVEVNCQNKVKLFHIFTTNCAFLVGVLWSSVVIDSDFAHIINELKEKIVKKSWSYSILLQISVPF